MKAINYHDGQVNIFDTPAPSGEGVLVNILASGICGTDIHIYNWDEWAQKTIPTPMVVGHEYAGEVVAIGQEVKGFNLGDRVSGEGALAGGQGLAPRRNTARTRKF